MTTRHSLILVPWHIGNRLDVTLRAARAAREIRIFLAEEPEPIRRQFESDLGVDCTGKRFLPIPEKEDRRFLKSLRASLRVEDVGLICSGGTPCFIDPGSWLVRELQAEAVPIAALAGASILSTMLSLSGVEWHTGRARGTFAIFLDDDPRGENRRNFLESVSRDGEPVFVFLEAARFQECLAVMAPALEGRLVTAFFDLTKTPPQRFPYADRMLTFDLRDWARQAQGILWKEVSDVSLMIHPATERP